MTGDLDDLRKALKAAPPASDPARKAAAMATAMQAFDAHQSERTQENAGAVRPMSDRPSGTGFLTGVLGMLANLTTRQGLAATASVAAIAVGLGVVLTTMPKGLAPISKPDVSVTADAPSPLKPVAEPPLPPAETVVGQDAAKKSADAAPAPAETTATVAETKPEADGTVIAGQAEIAAAEEQALAETAPADAELRRERVDQSVMADALAQSAPAGSMAAGGESFRAQAEGDFGLATVAPAPAMEPEVIVPEPNTEAFPEADANPVKIAATDPVSTFSIDVDTASYSVVRSSLMSGYLPPADAVRIEEMVNYFPYAYPAPKADEAPFKPTVSVIQTPWNAGTRLVHIGIQGRMPALADRPPLNLVFLIDTSGSMEDPNKLPLLIQSFRLMLGQLRPEDQVAIVTYAGSAGLVLEPTAAKESARITAALNNLAAGGSTAGQEGLQQAYAVAEGMADDGEVTRILLATDGDFNVGISDPEALKDFVADKRKSGTYLSVLGFGRGNLDDATMQALAQNGNGTAAYIDTLSEAQKVLVDQLSGALFPIADDVKIQMEFNPAVIAEYRLIGYETRALNREDFNNDKVDAGEIGAGTSVTAIYEVTPVGSPAVLSDPLRYQASDAPPAQADAPTELGFLKLRYKEPGASSSTLIELPVSPEPGEAGADTRFAVAVAGFGQLLTGRDLSRRLGLGRGHRAGERSAGRRPLRLPRRSGAADAAGAEPVGELRTRQRSGPGQKTGTGTGPFLHFAARRIVRPCRMQTTPSEPLCSTPHGAICTATARPRRWDRKHRRCFRRFCAAKGLRSASPT